MAAESANGGFLEEEKKLTIRIYSSYDEAGLAAANLEAHGIKCWVNSDDCAGWYSNLTAATGIRLHVLAADAEAATTLLDSLPTSAELNQLETEAIAAAPKENVPLKKLAWVQILVGIGIGVFLCLMLTGSNDWKDKVNYNYTPDGKCYEGLVYWNHKLKSVYQDRNLDGKWDGWAYYENGHLVRSEYDDNFDGKPDVFFRYSNNTAVTSELDTDFNGIPDLFCTYSNGIMQQIDVRPNGSKITITREIFKHGVVTELWRGGDSNGFFNVVEKYDEFYNPIGTKNPEGFRLLSPVAK